LEQQLPENENPIAALERAKTAINSARKDLKILYQEWAVMNETAKEIARIDLCASLIRRLEIAEKEILELVDIIE
jgi:hypothetical protein